MNLKTTAEVTEVGAHVATALAAMAAAWWFFRSSRAKPRLVFDLDCQFLPLRGNPGQLVKFQQRYQKSHKSFRNFL